MNDAKTMPSLQFDVFLVPYGYQVDVKDFRYCRPTDWTNGLMIRTVCKDYGGTYEDGQLRDAVIESILEALKTLEHTKLIHINPARS